MPSRITLKINTLMPEMLLNELTLRGVRSIRACRRDGRTIFVTTDRKGAAKIKSIAEDARLEISVVRVRGISSVFSYLRKRPTLPAAFLIMAACTAFFLSRIWLIDVEMLGGSIPDSHKDCIAQAGARMGAAFSDVDIPLLSLRLSALEGVAYASVARDGVVLKVELAGEDAPSEIYDINHARDLVAASDGVVSAVEVRSGTAMVSPGDTVRRGQLLIAGKERISAEETHPVGALGHVTARVWSEGFAQTSLTRTEKEFTGRVSFSVEISVPGKKFAIFPGEDFAAYDQTITSHTVGGLFLPVSVIRTEKREYIPRPVAEDPAAAKNRIIPLAIAEAEHKMALKTAENTEIIDKWIDFSMIDTDTLRARAVIEHTSDIAVTRRYLEEN